MDKHEEYMKLVGAKINASMNDIMKSGNRNAQGFMFSAQRIRKAAENLFFRFSATYNDPVKALYKSFSERPGLSNVNNVAGVDVVDINIAATQQSILGYLSAERGMDKPIDTLWFQGLKDVANGKWVNRPYLPMDKAIRNQLRGAFAEENVTSGTGIDLNTISNGSILMDTIQVVDTSTHKVVGKYVDGEILFNEGSTATIVDGVVTITTASANYKLVVGIDKTTEKDGAHTLKVKPATETIQVVAQPRRIILNQSYEDNSYMNKQAFELSQSGISLDFGKIAVNQLLDTYVKFLDFDSAMTTAETIESFYTTNDPIELDLTDYLLATSEAATKNDIVHKNMLDMNAELQNACGYGYNAILVDSAAASVLGNDKEHFVPNPNFMSMLDGVIGTYDGVPMLRHHSLNTNDGYGYVYGVYKAADGSLAPTVYAEYLAPYSCTPALNYDNPSEYSEALLSMSACKPVAEDADVQLGAMLKIKIA